MKGVEIDLPEDLLVCRVDKCDKVGKLVSELMVLYYYWYWFSWWFEVEGAFREREAGLEGLTVVPKRVCRSVQSANVVRRRKQTGKTSDTEIEKICGTCAIGPKLATLG